MEYIKKDLKKKKKKTKKEDPKEVEPPKEKGFLKGVFRKKEKSETQ